MPVGSVEAVVNVAVPIAPVCVKLGLVPVQPFESVTVTTMGKAPCCVVVPERRPAADSEKPVGRVLAVVKVAVPCALLWPKDWLKATPAVPVVVAGLVTVMVWQ